MRGAFVKALVELAEKDPSILLLTGDLGFMVMEPFSERFPERFFNVGIAEQNMVGLATGLAEAGFIPYVYSIVTFAALRPYEFVRNGPILHQLPVRIVGIGGGVEYGHDGATHHGLEDIGVMRLQPGIAVIAPADHQQARNAFLSTRNLPGPVYYRIGKDDKTIVPGLEGRFEVGRLQLIREGSDLLLVAMGSVVSEVASAAMTLTQSGISAAVAVVASLNPAPVGDLVSLLDRFPVVLTVEAHYVTGGVGSLVAEVIAEYGLNSRLLRLGIRNTPDGVTGSQAFLHQRYGISSEAIVASVTKLLGQTRLRRLSLPSAS
jgi:transketolase